MKYKIIIFIVVLTTFSEPGFTQTSFYLGPEIGISSSGWNTAVMWNNFHKCTPRVSPLIGLNGQINVNSHLQFSSAIQYQMIISHWDTIFSGGDSREKEELIFHKLCVPLKAGLSFKNKSNHSIFMGFRINYLASGKLKTVSHDSYGSSPVWTKDPFDSNQFTTLPKRFYTQFILGLSNTIGQNLKIDLALNIGGRIKFSRVETRYRTVTNTPYTSIANNSLRNTDFGISLTYFISAKKKEANTEN